MSDVYVLDPLADPRWREFAEQHPWGSVFHSPAWLESLRRTYGYEPFVVTTSQGTRLSNGLPLCRIRSRWTRNRIVSLPFSDHCEPLVEHVGEIELLTHYLAGMLASEAYKYVEIRPRSYQPGTGGEFAEQSRFYSHVLNIRQSLQDIAKTFHESCVQRKIQRAKKEELACETGRSGSLISTFYSLQVRTRRRHHLPPQPLLWFRNLADCFGQALNIRIAFKGEQPVAGILTLAHRKTLVYKYACSDPKFNHLGGPALLLWDVIQDAQRAGFEEIDMGRSDMHQQGLITFKEHWGAKRSVLTYWRFPVSACSATLDPLRSHLMKRLIEYAPDRLLMFAGSLIYKHWG